MRSNAQAPLARISSDPKTPQLEGLSKKEGNVESKDSSPSSQVGILNCENTSNTPSEEVDAKTQSNFNSEIDDPFKGVTGDKLPHSEQEKEKQVSPAMGKSIPLSQAGSPSSAPC